MTPVTPTAIPGEAQIVFAKDQPQYTPLPASVSARFRVTTEWEPDEQERDVLLSGGLLQVEQWAFDKDAQRIDVDDFRAAGSTRALDEHGTVTTLWEPSATCLERLLDGGHIVLRQHTDGNPLQPLRVSVAPPACGFRGGQ